MAKVYSNGVEPARRPHRHEDARAVQRALRRERREVDADEASLVASLPLKRIVDDRRWHLGDPAQHHRDARARPASGVALATRNAARGPASAGPLSVRRLATRRAVTSWPRRCRTSDYLPAPAPTSSTRPRARSNSHCACSPSGSAKVAGGVRGRDQAVIALDDLSEATVFRALHRGRPTAAGRTHRLRPASRHPTHQPPAPLAAFVPPSMSPSQSRSSRRSSSRRCRRLCVAPSYSTSCFGSPARRCNCCEHCGLSR